MAGETVLGALRYDFTADTSGLKSGLGEVTNSLKKVTDQVRQNTREFKDQGEQASKSIGLAKHEMLNLTRQLTDAGVSLASGMSPFMVLIQQGGQVADVFQSSKASIGSALTQILFSSKTMALGVVAAIGTIGLAAYNAQASLEKLSETAKAVGSNRTAMRDFGKEMSIIGVDPEKVSEQLVGLAERLREAQIKGGDLAKQLDAIGIHINNFDLSKPGDFARLFEEIATKVRNGSSELDRLNAIKLLGLSEEFRRVFMDGREAISSFVRASQDAAEESTKPLEDKWRNLRRIWSDFSQFVSDTSATIVNKIIDMVSAAIQKIGSLIDWVKGKYAELANFRFADEKTIAGKGQGEGISDYEKRLGLEDKKKPVQLPDITISKAKQTNLAPMFQDFKSGAAKGAKSGGAAGTDQIKTYIDGLREAASLSQAELDNWSKGNVEREKAMALVKAENIAKQEGRTLTAAQREEILSLAGQQEIAKQKVDELKYSQDRLNDAMQEFGDQVSRSLEDLIIRGQKASEVLRQLISQLASAALRGMLTGEGMFGKLFGMAGDKDGGLGGILGKAISFLPKFAAGGTLGAGRWGIAGEAGPELIRGPAHVTPFGKMGGQGAKVTVHNYSGAPVQTRQMSDGEILVMVGNMIQSNNKRVPGIVADAQRRSL